MNEDNDKPVLVGTPTLMSVTKAVHLMHTKKYTCGTAIVLAQGCHLTAPVDKRKHTISYRNDSYVEHCLGVERLRHFLIIENEERITFVYV